MRIILLSLAFGFFMMITPAEAQYDQAKTGLGIRATIVNYQWPALKDNLAIEDFTAGVEIEYLRHLNPFVNLALPLKITGAKLPVDESGNTRRTSLASMDLLLQIKLFEESNFLYPYFFVGIGGVASGFSDVHGVVPLGGGLNFRLSKHIYFSTKAEYRAGLEELRDNVQLAAGLQVLLAPPGPEPPKVTDSDQDGIPDEQDLCPNEAGTAGLNGCPDADQDGVPDGEDECPQEAGLASFSGCPDSDGDGVPDRDDDCPDEVGLPENNGCPLADADADGIPDDRDDCPGIAGLAALNGCPDRDGDGVADKDDNCPDVAGSPSAAGCPDSDGDGIIDPDDRCPNSVGPASNDGCPEISEEDEEVLAFATQAVQFETGSARLKPESRDVLNQIVEIMRRYPDYKLRISGHTDSIGSASTNQELSEERAEACYEYLVSQGINPSRMSFAGYGESRPIADNRYKDGREQNRRVEFDLFLQ